MTARTWGVRESREEVLRSSDASHRMIVVGAQPANEAGGSFGELALLYFAPRVA